MKANTLCKRSKMSNFFKIKWKVKNCIDVEAFISESGNLLLTHSITTRLPWFTRYTPSSVMKSNPVDHLPG